MLSKLVRPLWVRSLKLWAKRPLERSLLEENSPTPKESHRVLSDQIRVLMLSTPKNLATGIVAAFVIAFAMWAAAPAPKGSFGYIPWFWFLSLTFFLLRGINLSRPFAEANFSVTKTVRTSKALQKNGIICGFLWGASSWIMLPHPSENASNFLVVVIAMVLMGGSASQAIYRPVLLGFVVPTFSIFTIGLAYQGEFKYTFLTVAFPLLAYVILSAARVQENAVRTAILLRLRSENLLRDRIHQQSLIEKSREEAEQARSEAELANHSKTAFLAAAGHDLRQPMHALTLYFGHLQRKNKDQSLDDTVDRIGKSIDAMQDLLDSILQVSKLMMGSVKPVITTFPVSDVLERIDVQLRPLAEDKGLSFTVDSCTCPLKTDEVLLERVLRNLVLNAIRYTNTGFVAVRCKEVAGKLRLQVLDTGVGIKREDIGRIFEEFYQVENEARDRKRGLGLGLSIVRQLCTLLDIKLTVRSTFGKGSVFSLRLPLTDETRNHIAPPERQAPDYVRGSFIVLIDDNDASLEAMAISLKEFGCNVVAAKSGLEAIERLQGQEFMPHLIVSDYRLGEGQTGIDAIRMVIDNQQALYGEEFDIPALVVSGDTAPEELRKVQEAGYAMLHKPVKLEVLYKEMNRELEILANDGVACNP